jgi:flavin-dependent dehydrogenase
MGAGPAGLLAARVLAENFERVTVLEREPLPIDFDFRGRPDDRPMELLQPTAAQSMEQLDPGLLDSLVDDGVPVLRGLDEMQLEMAGHVMCRAGALAAPLHRPGYAFLMERLRARRPARVEIRYRTVAVDLLVTEGRVAGVVAETPDGVREIPADLVVDAAGRAGSAASWLSRWGLPTPEEDRLNVDVRCVSLRVHRYVAPTEVESLYLSDSHPGRPCGLHAGRIERNRWVLSVFGYGGNHPPAERDELLAFVSRMLPEPWLRVFAEADPDEAPVAQDIPTVVRRRWDLVRNLPAGILPVGDAWCSPNPVHYQGLTLAAHSAVALRDALRAGAEADLPSRYLAAAAPTLNRAWQLAYLSDRAYPQISGIAPDRQGEAMLHAILEVAERDPEVLNALLQINWGVPGKSLQTTAVMARTSKVGRTAKRDAKRDAKHVSKDAKHQSKAERRLTSH